MWNRFGVTAQQFWNGLLAWVRNMGVETATGICAVIVFVANVITVISFVRDILTGDLLIFSENSFSRTLVIVVFFAFALALFIYSRNRNRVMDSLIWVFAWIYIICSALIFAQISYYFLLAPVFGNSYTFYDYLSYITMIMSICALGTIMSMVARKSIKYFAIPFMLIAVEHALIWVFLVNTGVRIVFDQGFAGNMVLFILAGLTTVFYLAESLLEEIITAIYNKMIQP